MDATQLPPPPSEPTRRRRWLGPAGLLVGGLIAGGLIAGTQVAGAQGSSRSSPSVSAPAPGTPVDPTQMRHGPGEELLTSDLAQQVKAAALAAVPGATVIRVETDADGGGTYEAHLQRDDGTFVTVRFDENLEVVGTDEGFGPGGMHAPGSYPGAPSSGSSGAAN